LIGASLSRSLRAVASALLTAAICAHSPAQQTNPHAKQSTPAPTEKNAAQIELLETKYRFETNGDSRKEVHARVRINNELGVRQFARLNFDFNRSFQAVEIPLVRITHASGGIADILPSAITDNPNPAVVDYPAYHDVRVKSVRILGLAPDDLLEYRVVTTTTRHPLAPDFWLDHTFDRTGVVSHEIFAIELPKACTVKLRTSPGVSNETAPCNAGENICATTKFYLWEKFSHSETNATSAEPDIALTTFSDWAELAKRLASMELSPTVDSEVSKQSRELAAGATTIKDQTENIYRFVSEKIATVDIPLGTNGFRTRTPSEILSSRYASPEDKFSLFAALAEQSQIVCLSALAMTPEHSSETELLALPSLLTHQLIWINDQRLTTWLDPGLEVAPFGAIPSNLRGGRALTLDPQINAAGPKNFIFLMQIPGNPPSPALQRVNVSATIAGTGELKAKVKYALRGDNELLLRVAFHKTPKEKWKDVAQMLALSDGFRGQIVNVTASDPYATKEPFTVEYEISQPKFVDWSKKTVHIPAILPLPGLPDPPTAAQASSGKAIELGTPLAIDLEAAIELPPGATAQAPIGTTVNRDYATFSSKYSAQGNTLHAIRSLHFISSELPAARTTDLNAFLHAVQSDQAQLFTITPAQK